MTDKKQRNQKLGVSSLLDAVRSKVTGKSKHVAESLYKDNRIESLRVQRIEEGIVPWTILRYQHIVVPKEIPLPLAPSTWIHPETFRSHLQYIKDECSPLPLAELVRRIYVDEALPERAVAITIDNGHADHFFNAFKILLEFQLPATFCLPTGYIDSNSFLPIDRITIGLLALQKLGKKLPEFKDFDESFYAELRKLSPSLAVTPEVIVHFLDGFKNLDENARANIINSFAEAMGEVIELPDYEDFLRWEEVHKMSEFGATFASMGHGFFHAPLVERDLFVQDVLQSVKVFTDEQIPMEKYFCFTEGVFNLECLEALREIGFRCALSIGDIPKPSDEEREYFMLLGRIPMFESCAESVPLFASRMFRLVVDDVHF